LREIAGFWEGWGCGGNLLGDAEIDALIKGRIGWDRDFGDDYAQRTYT
jgi:hypothetical protein